MGAGGAHPDGGDLVDGGQGGQGHRESLQRQRRVAHQQHRPLPRPGRRRLNTPAPPYNTIRCRDVDKDNIVNRKVFYTFSYKYIYIYIPDYT